MQHQATIKIDNLKCGGCATSIEMGLLAMDGVNKAHVVHESEEVEVSYSDAASIAMIKNKLRQMGYPETGTTEGLDKLAANVKSYVSCAIGKINTNEEHKQ